MTIKEVLHTVQDSGLVNGYPQRLEGDEKHGVVALGGPRDRTYSVLDVTCHQLSESEAAALPKQNMVPGRYATGKPLASKKSEPSKILHNLYV